MGIWKYELSLGLDVLLRTCGFQPFLRDLVGVVVPVVNSELRGVVRLRDPK